MIESFVPVPMLDLDAPVPQMVDQLVDVLKLFDNSVPEQVIDVPKISQDALPQRTVLWEPQLAEQLVEVPTVPFSSSRPLTFQRRGTRCSLPLMDTSGAGSWSPLGCTSGGLAPSTPSGDPRRDTPPAQGGIEILGNADHALQVPAVLADLQWRYLRFVHRQSVGHRSSWLVVYMPVVVPTTGPGSDSGENCCSAVAFL